VRIRAISVLAACLGLAACGGSHATDVTPGVQKSLVRLEHRKAAPLYYLGQTWDGLQLVLADDGFPGMVSFGYADCSAIEADTLSPKCHRMVSVDNGAPAAGEISTQGRCFFSRTMRGATAAFFPVNPQTFRVFTRGDTLYVSSVSRKDTFAAVRALRGLNNKVRAADPLPSRDVSSLLGRCHARVVPQTFTSKERYQQQMKSSFFIGTVVPVTLGPLSPNAAAFLNNMRTYPLLLRNEAVRIDNVQPPHGVASLQAELSTELRAYARTSRRCSPWCEAAPGATSSRSRRDESASRTSSRFTRAELSRSSPRSSSAAT
jgi:hypothetical protein